MRVLVCATAGLPSSATTVECHCDGTAGRASCGTQAFIAFGAILLVIATSCDRSAPPPKPPPGDNATPTTPQAANTVNPFNGTDLTGWRIEGNPSGGKWKVGSAALNPQTPGQFTVTESPKSGGHLINTAVGNNIYTTAKFGDALIELDVMLAAGANSGIYIMGEYEFQLDARSPTTPVSDMDHGAIARVAAPLKYMEPTPGQWQSIAIDYRAPRFDDAGKKTANAVILSVTIDGQVIHRDVELPESGLGCLTGEEHPAGPVMLQGLEGAVAFRNIRITPRQ